MLWFIVLTYNTWVYMTIHDSERWKVELIKEITDIKFGVLDLYDYPHDELEDILKYICTS